MATWRLEKSKEAKLRRQIENCTMHAPFDGLIVLHNNPNRRIGAPEELDAGASVNLQQPILTLAGFKRPDAGERQSARGTGRPDQTWHASQGHDRCVPRSEIQRRRQNRGAQARRSHSFRRPESL